MAVLLQQSTACEINHQDNEVGINTPHYSNAGQLDTHNLSLCSVSEGKSVGNVLQRKQV